MDTAANTGILTVETEQEPDGRWLAEVLELPGVMAYGATRDEAQTRVEALALRVLAEKRELGEPAPMLRRIFSVARFILALVMMRVIFQYS